MSTPPAVDATVEMNATPEAVWALLADPTRMPEFSPELRKAFTFGAPGLGQKILGINRRKAVAWPTSSRIVRWEPNQAVAWKTRESGATWVYELTPTAAGTSVTARRVLPAYTLGSRMMVPLLGGAAGHDRELANGLAETLGRIKAVVER